MLVKIILVKNMTTQDQDILMKRKKNFGIEKIKYLGLILTNINYILFQNNYAKE